MVGGDEEEEEEEEGGATAHKDMVRNSSGDSAHLS